MERQHKNDRSREGDQDQEQEDQTPLAAGRQAKQQQALQKVRQTLKSKVTTEYRETVMNSLLVFRGMCSGDALEAAKEELSPDIAGAIKDKLVDKIAEKLKDGIKEGLELSSKLGSFMSSSFGAIKGKLDGIVKAEKKITSLQLVDAVVGAAYESMETYCDKAGSWIDSMPSDQLVDIYRILAPFKNVKSNEDSDEMGSLKHGLETWALEEKLGLPKTGGAIVHELAQHYYLEYRAELRQTMPVHEQANELKNIGKLGLQTDHKAAEAEEQLGPHMTKSVEKDQRERARTNAT